jgi:hypothetical protein
MILSTGWTKNDLKSVFDPVSGQGPVHRVFGEFEDIVRRSPNDEPVSGLRPLRGLVNEAASTVGQLDVLQGALSSTCAINNAFLTSKRIDNIWAVICCDRKV